LGMGWGHSTQGDQEYGNDDTRLHGTEFIMGRMFFQ
jgi:hypothetical protein